MLVDELGVEPGEELRRLHEQVLARDPALAVPAEWDAAAAAGGLDAARVVPRQLPAAVARFAGRSDELGGLAGLAGQGAHGGAGTGVMFAVAGEAPGGANAPAAVFAAP